MSVPAFTEANRRKVDPSACACRVGDGEIIRCPLHNAAPDLANALRECLPWLQYVIDNPDEGSVARRNAKLAKGAAEATLKKAGL